MGAAPMGSDITADGQKVGTLYSQANGMGLAHMRFDRIQDGMRAGDVHISMPKD